MTLSLRGLAAKIEKTVAADKGKLPWIKGAAFGEEHSEKNCLRTNRNMLSVSAILVDYDGGKFPNGGLAPEEAQRRLAAAGIHFLVATTASHGLPDKGNCFRVFAPCSHDLPPADHEHLVARINGLMDGQLDDKSFTLSQGFYYGGTHARPATTFLVEGSRYIDRADDLDGSAIFKPKRLHANDSGEAGGAIGETETNLLENIAASVDLHSSTYDLGMLMAQRGFPEADAVATIQAAFPPIATGEMRLRDRFNDVKRTVAAAYNVIGPRRDPANYYIPGKAFTEEDVDWINDDARVAALLGNIDEGEDAEPEPKGLALLTFQTPAECAATPSRVYLWKGMLAAGDVAAIVGAPGAGKSTLAPRLAYAVAQGTPVFGRRVKQGSVLYVAGEDAAGMRARLAALRQEHGEAEALALVSGVSDLLTTGSPQLVALRRAVKERRPPLVILDTLAACFPGLEENSAEGMGHVVKVARSLAQWGAAVVLLHHDAKVGDGLPRGHSLLNGALDMVLTLTREGRVVRGCLRKNRNGPPEGELAFEISTVTLGQDEDGDPIGVAVAREIAAGDLPKREARLSPSANAALRRLSELIEREGKEVASGRPGVASETWREACCAGAELSASDNRANRRKTFTRAVQELATKGRVEHRDGFWLLPTIGSASKFLDSADQAGGEG